MQLESQNNPQDETVSTKCHHLIRIDSLCAFCGMELPMDSNLVPAVHHTDRIFRTTEEARRLQKKRNKKLDKCRKMILILDIDQTLLHTSLIPTECDVQFTLGPCKFFVELRPHLKIFLEKVSKLFEIHIYTLGTRDYALAICKSIDPDGRFFGERIVSRTENLLSQEKFIDRITCVYRNVVILDDREDVWNYNKHLILIRPFWFKNTVDINDPNRAPLYVTDDNTGENKVPESPNAGQAVQTMSVNDKLMSAYCKNTELDNRDDHATEKDIELLNALKVLKSVHRKYFKERKSVSKTLRLKFMKDLRIAASIDDVDLVIFAGAKIDMESPMFVLEDKSLAQIFKLRCVKKAWIYECIYKRKMIPIEGYITCDYTVKDDYQAEIEKELF